MVGLEPQHEEILESLQDFQRDQLFSDFTIHLKEGAVRVSRILIAAMSPVFRNMLTLDMAERKDREVSMRHVSANTWACIMQFYFSTEKLVSVENVGDVIEVCDLYGLERLKLYCSDFLLSCLCPENCLGVKRIATQFNLKDPAEKACRIVAENFSAVCKSSNFFCLDKAELLQLLGNEELITTEDELCGAMLSWMRAVDADAETCTELFQQLHLEEMSNDCLGKQVLYHDVTKRVPEIESVVAKEVMKRLDSHFSRPPQKSPQKRRLRGTAESMMVLGRAGGHSLQFLWSPELHEWCPIPPPPKIPEGMFAATIAGNTVVVTGGGDHKSSFLFDLKSKLWSVGPDLHQARKYHGMAAVLDTAYAVAGRGIASIEEYSKVNRKWTPVGNLHTATDECGVTSLEETILVVGGDTDDSANLMQSFNVLTKVAAILDVRLPRPMRHVRAASYGVTACFLGKEGDLILVSQDENSLWLTSHIRLARFGTKTWFGLSVDQESVRVIGGDDSQSVACWNFQGEKVAPSDLADLPVKMSVYAALRVNIDLF